ncbi:MAG: hypothetical protein HZB26_22145 [Candidatus Hydrogenedentes bacterium]|nr:hypothetical protein [Candidatus Hydrogenedentota bacterium]
MDISDAVDDTRPTPRTSNGPGLEPGVRPDNLLIDAAPMKPLLLALLAIMGTRAPAAPQRVYRYPAAGANFK